MTIGILFILDSSSDTFYIVLAGPDAVQFIVNHATVEVIFCVPQTLSIVSFNLCSQSWTITRSNNEITNETYEAIC